MVAQLERIGHRVKEARKARRWTRERLASEADVSLRYLSLLEQGSANPSLGVLEKVAQSLSVTLTELLSDEAPPRPGYAPMVDLMQRMSLADQQRVYDLVAAQMPEIARSRRGIALVGLRGAGKTTLGEALSKRFDVPFIRLTSIVEDLAGMNVNELFSLGGADAYRNLEREAVERVVADHPRSVVETAGGVIANAEAFEAIRAHFVTVWLKAQPEDHLSRVSAQGDTRPMRGHDQAIRHIKALLAERAGEYGRADHQIETSGLSVATVLAELTERAKPVFEHAPR